jgi:cytochrome c-type biogenesis protein CcmH/NrfG
MSNVCDMVGKRSATVASAAASDSTVVDALYVLAVRYEQNGNYLQAIKALKAICSLDLPAAATTQYTLHLAKLLMKHTENKEDAKKILEGAVSTSLHRT